MTNKEKQEWLKDNYPLTIITDRYSGTYSDGYYLAFPLDFDEIPSAVNDSDPECAEFWGDYSEPVGKGSSVQAAIEDLIYKMRSNVIIDVPFGAQDSELKGWEYTIPEGMEAELKDGKIIVRQKESEDERIRKGLIEALKISKTVGELKFILSEPIKEECLAYLEKREKQKHPNGCFTCDEYKKGYEAGRFHGFTAGYNKAMKEQKPAEWSEEDEKMIERLITRLNWITYNTRTDGTSPNITFLEEIDWLKSLRPRPKQEKSDYITPHKQFFKWIYDRLVNVHKENPDVDYMISFKKRIEELSFDNPSWKPSEEQMGALAKAVTFFKTKWTGAKVKEQLALESLYEDLKKL